MIRPVRSPTMVSRPETLIAGQVALFHSAEFIAGSSSSALTNDLSCRPDCTILGMIHENLSFNLRSYTSFIKAGGEQIGFLHSRSAVSDGIDHFRANYIVNRGKLLRALNAFLLPQRPSKVLF